MTEPNIVNQVARTGLSRRSFLVTSAAALAGVGLAACGSGGSSTTASSTPAVPPVAPGTRISARAWGFDRQNGPLRLTEINHRPTRGDDVVIDVRYAGVCHSDIHTARDWGPVPAMTVPGHEVIGQVRQVGPDVTRFRVGDTVGVGTMVGSCGQCEYCRAGQEQYCANGTTWTYGPDGNGGMVYGGYSDTMVVPEHFTFAIPAGLDPTTAAPLLCAGATTYSPLNNWEVPEDATTAVVGFGGLGHLATQHLAARGNNVTVFTTTPDKSSDARALGASDVVTWQPEQGPFDQSAEYDFVIATVPTTYNVDLFTPLLATDGVFVNLGALGPITGINGGPLVLDRRTVAGSTVAGVPETQQMLDFCAEHDVSPRVESIPVSDINEAWDRVQNKEVRYRYVIDMSTI